jgi:hypothetical protein
VKSGSDFARLGHDMTLDTRVNSSPLCKLILTRYMDLKSKSAQHAYEEGHKICWNEVKVLKIERNTTCGKYEESAHRSLIDHPIW